MCYKFSAVLYETENKTRVGQIALFWTAGKQYHTTREISQKVKRNKQG